MDEIELTGLKVYAYHGVYAEEKEKGQGFIIDVKLRLDLTEAGLTDDLKNTVDYGAAAVFIKDRFTARKFDLIEAAAEDAARALLLEFKSIRSLSLKASKPDAPIPTEFGNVSVTVERGWHKAYIALGSNMEDKKGYIDGAVAAFKENKSIRGVKVSSYMDSAPYGGVADGDFVNACLMCETIMRPRELLSFAMELENKAGRVRTRRWGSRTLDVDILMYDDLVTDDPELVLPHREMHLRDFVLLPLAEIAPDAVHPLYKKRVSELADTVTKVNIIK